MSSSRTIARPEESWVLVSEGFSSRHGIQKSSDFSAFTSVTSSVVRNSGINILDFDIKRF